MSLVSPYKNIFQYTRISLAPHNLNSDIKNNIMFKLKNSIEKKCNKYGFIENIYEIAEYKDGIIMNEDFSGNVIFNVKYYCKLCLPVINTVIIGQIKLINQELIIANNGPMYIFITNNNINDEFWKVNNNEIVNKKTKNKLKENNLVKILILDKRINANSKKINLIGKLQDFATEDEIKKYYQKVEKKDDDKSNFI